METLNSQEMKDIFNDKNNDKEYDVFIYAAFNLYPVKGIVKDGKKIIIETFDIGAELSD